MTPRRIEVDGAEERGDSALHAPQKKSVFVGQENMNDKLRYQVVLRDRGFCQYCGFDHATSYAAFAAHEIDHVVMPRGQDGCDAIDNLKLSCSGCNKMLGGAHKRKLTLDTFEKRREYIEKQLLVDKLSWFPKVQAEILESLKTS
jgi:5-methylcytosine-specific restriction endonuclease McrA